MKVKIADRIQECSTGLKNLTSEMNDYNTIVICIKALQAAAQYPNKFKYSDEDYKKVVDKLYKLCAKHEIQLSSDYVEWSSVEII